MKYSWRVLVAAQFALWAFFFSSIIPFSGDILLPVVWIFNKRMVIWYALLKSVEVIPYIPAVSSALLPILERVSRVHAPQDAWFWFTVIYMTMTPGFLVVSIVSSTLLGSFIVRKKIKRKAPDLWGMIKR